MPVCMGILPLTALAAGDITGKVINKETGDPMDFVTVQLVNAATGKPLPIAPIPMRMAYSF